jgi:hypothetical protein
MNAKQFDVLKAHNLSQVRVPVKRGDVILWRSDLVHCGAPPIGARSNFRAVVYVCCLPASLTPEHVYKDKLQAYEEVQTGCHWPNREEWFQLKRSSNKNAGIVPYYDGQQRPQLTKRLEQLYGLVRYEEEEGETTLKKDVSGDIGDIVGGGGGGSETMGVDHFENMSSMMNQVSVSSSNSKNKGVRAEEEGQQERAAPPVNHCNGRSKKNKKSIKKSSA